MSELSHRQADKLIQGKHLSAQERDALEAHLRECEACRHYLTMHLHLSQNLQLDPVCMQPAPELKAALRRRVNRNKYLEKTSSVFWRFTQVKAKLSVALIQDISWLLHKQIINIGGIKS